jgi:hypothetical protein
MQVEHEEIEQIESQTLESDAYSLFVYAVRAQVTRDYYLRRLKIFLISLAYFH